MASPAKKRKRNPNFRIEFAGDNDEKNSVLENLQKIRSELTNRYNQPVGNCTKIRISVFINKSDSCCACSSYQQL